MQTVAIFFFSSNSFAFINPLHWQRSLEKNDDWGVIVIFLSHLSQRAAFDT